MVRVVDVRRRALLGGDGRPCRPSARGSAGISSADGLGGFIDWRSLRPTAGADEPLPPARTPSTWRTTSSSIGRQREVDRAEHVRGASASRPRRRRAAGAGTPTPARRRRGPRRRPPPGPSPGRGATARRSRRHHQAARIPMTRPPVGRSSPPPSVGGRPRRECSVTRPAYAGEMSTSHARGRPVLGRHPVRRVPAPLPARPPRRRPGRRRGAGRDAGHPVHQDDRQGLRPRPRDPDGRPDHARGPGHPRQGALAVREGHAPRPDRPDLPLHRGGLRLPRHGRHRQGGPGRQRRPRRRGRDGLPERPGRDGHQARRHQGRRRGRRRRDRHGHRPGRVPHRPLPRRCSRRSPRSARPAAPTRVRTSR